MKEKSNYSERTLPTLDRLRELLNYDPQTGLLYHAIDRSWRVRSGDLAGTKRRDGFVVVCVDYKSLLAHRVAWALGHGAWPKYEVGHRDGDRSNNALDNLIDAPRSAHHICQRKACIDSKTGHLGVGIAAKGKNRFWARVNGVDLGFYSTASEAYQVAAKHRESLASCYREELFYTDISL